MPEGRAVKRRKTLLSASANVQGHLMLLITEEFCQKHMSAMRCGLSSKVLATEGKMWIKSSAIAHTPKGLAEDGAQLLSVPRCEVSL